MRITRGPRLIAAALLALGLLTACGSDSESAPVAEQATPSAVARDLASYDAFVLASAENNPLAADVYAIRFAPFAIDRITTGKRISSIGADTTNVIVAAADQDVDRLAQLTGTGTLEPIPGLGRPHAFQPKVVDGVVYYDDIDPDDRKDENRFWAFDLQKGSKKLLFRSVEGHAGLTPLSGGRLLYGTTDENGETELVIRQKSGRETTFPLGKVGGAGGLGRDWYAATIAGQGDNFGEKPEGLLLLNPTNRKSKQVPGLQMVAWNPAGTHLLVRQIDSSTDSRLMLLDPANPDKPVDIHTVPGLVIFGGIWVRGDAPAAH